MEYYATLGYTPRVLLAVKALVAADPRVTVFHGDPTAAQEQAVTRGRVILEELGVKFRFVQIDRPWNIEFCLEAISSQHKADGRSRDLLVNASGGTEVMNAAATVFAFLVGCPAEYVDRTDWSVHRIEFGALTSGLALRGSRRRVLDAIIDAGGSIDLSLLPRAVNLSAGAITQHLQTLVDLSLVRVERRAVGRGKTVHLDDRATALRFLGAPPKNAPKRPRRQVGRP